MAEHIKVTPIYESNPVDSVENPTYCVSKVVGVVIEELPQEPTEEAPKYIVPKEDTGVGGGSSSDNNKSLQRSDSSTA